MSAPVSKPLFYYGWINVVLGALIMLATLPGRTHGLGLITEPLLKDLQLDRVAYANINLWATLVGALFCLPVGWLIDRFGVRLVTTVTVLFLAGVVWQISAFSGGMVWFFILITLTRGLGQSALSVTSITAVGKWFTRRLGVAMGVYSFLLTVLFMLAFQIVGKAVYTEGWRVAWLGIALFLLLVVAPLVWLFVRNSPESIGVAPDTGPANGAAKADEGISYTLSEAMRTPAFWVFALATSLYGLVSSGLGLFNQAVLAERGFTQKDYITLMTVTTFIGLLGQLGTGWAMSRFSVCRLMSIAMFLYGGALAFLPTVRTKLELGIFALFAGIAGGIIMVVFFAIWGKAFGRAHLGRIQSAAQILTVLTSAIGPLIFAKCHALKGSYSPALWALAFLVLVLGVISWWVTLPAAKESPASPLPVLVPAAK